MFGLSSSSDQDCWYALPSAFAVALPGLLESRELTRRSDSKFVMPLSVMLDVATALVDDYAAIGPAASYDTLYFDTPELVFYHDHRRGRRLRHKLRVRHYCERQLSYLEIKSRRSAGLTTKARRQRAFGDNAIGDADLAFIREVTGVGGELVPIVHTSYERLTLIGTTTEERITFDTNLRFRRGEHELALRGVAIIEVKQPRRDRRTPVMATLRDRGVRPTSASKYCAAVTAHGISTRSSPRSRALWGATP